VFDCSAGLASFIGEYIGLNDQLTNLHMIDDLTLYSKNIDDNKTLLLGADSTGRSIAKFSLDGSVYETIPLPADLVLQCPTSVRWSKGPGFDPNSVYVTEGGGATRRVTDRRVLQIPLN
jgi:hypothetical protein